MARASIIALAVAAVCAAASPAQAQTQARTLDGYCDYVKGVAGSESALLMAPELFTSFGLVDQSSATSTPGSGRDDLRLTMGVGYSVSNLYRSRLVRRRADAACKRHRALSAVNDKTTGRALEARAQVLAEALTEAESMLERSVRDLERRRTTRQELIATRLQVEKLREQAAATKRQLDTLPVSGPEDRTMARALAAYYAADGEFEAHESSLRTAQAWDIGVRFGYDKFLDNDDSSPFFALVTARVNLGRLLQGRSERRAAEGRRRIVRDSRGMAGVDVTAARLRSLLAIDRKRAGETGLLVNELREQLDQLERVGGDASRRLRQTVWFEWVEARAEHEYLLAHVASLQLILGQEATE